MSLADEIFQEQEPVFEPITVFGRSLLVKAMSGRDFGQLQKAVLDFENANGEIKSDQEVTKAGVAVICLHDQNRQRVFPFASNKELKAIVNRVADQIKETDLAHIYKVASPLSALDTDIEEAEKNSAPAPAKSGGTASPEN